MDDNQRIREFESEILDKNHENFAFYQYSEDVVIPYLLQVYGDTERHRDNLVKTGHNEINLSFYLNNMIHGIGHCIRWMIKQKHPKFHDTSDLTPRQILEMATDFLGWGTGYHMIAQEFVTWTREIKTAILDEPNKRITFLNPGEYDYSRVYDKQLLYAEQRQSVYLSYPHDEMEDEFTVWVKDIDFSKPPIANHINWKRGRSSKSFPLLYEKMCEILFPELSEITEFDGYNLRQLRQFYALFFLNFHFIRWVEAMLDSQAGERQLAFGSNPLYLNQEKFVQLASSITGLSLEISSAIIADLTFNPDNFHTSVSIQPFVKSSSGIYYILPNLFSQLEPSRMFLGAINKSGKKKIYDSKLINTIEKSNLDYIYKSINQYTKWTCYLEKVIKYEGKQIHPDLIIIDSDERSLCVIDYKHFIGPITASEVDYKMNEIRKGLIQVENYIFVLTAINKLGIVNITNFKVYGILLTHTPLPVPIPSDTVISITDVSSFIDAFNLTKHLNGSLTQAIQKIPPDMTVSSKIEMTVIESEIQVGEWKIKRQQHKIA